MNKSESIGELAKALAQAQGKIRGALKDSDNPYFKSRYADLASVVEAIRDALSAVEIAYIQTTEPSDKDEVRVETMLVHSSGQWISGLLALPVTKADAQGYGSALTYCRRYGLSAACGVAPEDDDGNAAVGNRGEKKANEFLPKKKAEAPTEQVEAAPGTTFTVAGQAYTTAGMTEAQYLKTLELIPQVDKLRGRGAARKLLTDTFPVRMREELTQEQAERYIALLELALA